MRALSSALLPLALLLIVRLPAQGAGDQVWIGISLEEKDDAIVVTEVVPRSPGDLGGLKVGDRLEKIGNKAFTDLDTCIEFVLSLQPGSTQAFQVKRGDKSLRLRVKLGSRADRDRAAGKAEPEVPPQGGQAPRPKARLGVVLEEAGDHVRIAEVEEDGPAARAGFRKGDVLHKAGGEAVGGVDAFVARIVAAGPGAKLPVEVLRDGKPVLLEPVLGGGDRPARPGGPAPMSRPAGEPSGEAVVARPTLPVFGGDIGPAVAAAKTKGKLVLVAFLDGESAASKQVQESLGAARVQKALEAYVTVDVDVVAKAEVADRFGVLATPHFVVLDGDGRTVGKFTGYLPAGTLAARLDRYVAEQKRAAAAAAAAVARPTDEPEATDRPTDRPASRQAVDPRRQPAPPAGADAELRRRMQQAERARAALEEATKKLDQVRRENEELRKRIEAMEEALRKLQQRK